jgi:hypothetical protein
MVFQARCSPEKKPSTRDTGLRLSLDSFPPSLLPRPPFFQLGALTGW